MSTCNRHSRGSQGSPHPCGRSGSRWGCRNPQTSYCCPPGSIDIRSMIPGHSRNLHRNNHPSLHGPLTRYVKLRVRSTHASGMSETCSPPPRVTDSDKHHGTCVTLMPWCMPWPQTSRFLSTWCRGNVPRIPGACATRNFTYLLRSPWTLVIPLDNSSPPSAAYMHQWIGSALVQIMACRRLFGTKPLSKPVLGYCQLDP